MAADPKNTPRPGEPSREQMMRVLIPAGAIALIVILVAVLVAGFGDGDKPGAAKNAGGKPPGGYPPPTGGTDVSKLSDGTEPIAEDGGLKDMNPNFPGLKYRDLKVGDGPEVNRGATVTAYYTGWLTNGSVFDSSRKRGEPIPFSLDEVIKGWTEGIPGMKVGGIRKLYIPAELAYGARGRPGIPANSTLIFEVEIVDTK
ncbi:MAG TPA: FKBP-type peptidyl-prolyl cis-trans isomerase [Gemmata sp.]|nr:FKBP-type peptidyl-prolyl cis-trans isomerase [Gemmata sp.]